MTHRTEHSDHARHARLFELIRQDNLSAERTLSKPNKSTLGLSETQQFLKQAHSSLAKQDYPQN